MENKIKTKIKTSEERLEQCGWFVVWHDHNTRSTVYPTIKIDDIEIELAVDTETGEIEGVTIKPDEPGYAEFTTPQMLLLMEKLKELEVEPEEN